eukprot:671891-Pelagomonas_calceolata.AAC.1
MQGKEGTHAAHQMSRALNSALTQDPLCVAQCHLNQSVPPSTPRFFTVCGGFIPGCGRCTFGDHLQDILYQHQERQGKLMCNALQKHLCSMSV